MEALGNFFLWLGFFVILILILNDVFPVFKYMCAHITVPMEDCTCHNGCFFFFSLNLKVSLMNRSPAGTWSQKEQIENDELLTLEIAP